jgi:c(7)-type cytochrome triheme protein
VTPISLPGFRWIFFWLLTIVLSSLARSSSQETSPAGKVSQQSEDLIFSHRFHLTKTTASCQDCHTNVSDSSAATDNNLPSEKDCLKCHDGLQARNQCTVCHKSQEGAGSSQNPVRTFRFDHKRHLELGNLAPVIAAAIDSGNYLSPAESIRMQLDQEIPCLACHRGLEQTDLAGKANLPQMADCLVCHAEIDPPFSCEFCHTKEAKIKPVSHTPDFLDLHNSGKLQLKKQSCKICHGTHFRCMGCH